MRNYVVTPEIFWARVDKTPGLGRDGDCWEWRHTLTRGYGTVRFQGKQQMAHRVAYYLTFGHYPTDKGLHSCDNPSCVNPAHLRDGTQADNIKDMWERGRSRSAKLTIEQVREIKQRIANGEIGFRLRLEYGVTDTAIYYARDAQVWGGVRV
jgi:hypothetical protein